MDDAADNEVLSAIAVARQSPWPDPDDVLRHVFVERGPQA
jgi:TPP-dependent pyruvate/acetoin dehydrogenase alpha subunit